jgi:SAM-dependent methyltransferase
LADSLRLTPVFGAVVGSPGSVPRSSAASAGRAISAPRCFIAYGEPARTEESFFQSGESNVREHIHSDLENICQARDPGSMRIVEIGCGAGRLTKALAALFGEVHAVDVSAEMIRLATEEVGALPNVRLYVNNGADLSALPSIWARAA